MTTLWDFPTGPDSMTQAASVPRSYPIFVEVEYELTHLGSAKTGHGWTESLSSRNIEFIAAGPLPPDHRVDLSIAWPALLNGKVGLRLCIRGRITKSRDHYVSVKIERYEFRTKASTPRQLVLTAAPR
jgi:hypothetical protein